MKQRIPPMTDERGQTLVWVALGMIVLMGILALAVDVGHLYAERRHMQNAADAGALEAARARCFDNDTPEAAAAKGAAFTTANNSRPDAISQTYAVVPDAGNNWQFVATASEQTPTYFARALGISQVAVQATARAACGPSPVACGLFPLAFNQAIWNGIADQCGQQFYVWTSELDRDPNPAGQPTPIPPDCTRCDCSKVYSDKQMKNLIPGAIAVADVGRAWLDFTSAASELTPIDCAGKNGCGANELKCWIQSDSQVLILKDTCVSGTSGIKLGVKGEINARATAAPYVTIPLYDKRCNTSGGTGDCDPQGFNIVDFGCVQVGGLDPQKIYVPWRLTPTPDPTPGKPADDFCTEEKMLYVSVACNKCDTECGKTSGGGNPGSGIKAVSLIK